MLITKRDGSTEPFDKNKIVVAIEKAMNSQSGMFVEGQAMKIADFIEAYVGTDKRKSGCRDSVSDIEKLVFYRLIEENNVPTAKAYEGYRAVHEYKRLKNTSDTDILHLVRNDDAELRDDNSNKNAALVSTQRDLIAEEVSKDLSLRKLLPAELAEAHKNGVIHIHDLGYMIQKEFNCCLINLQDMLDKGTVINGCMVESPHSFQTACTITTQIIAQVASSQYGGQSINGIDRILAPYVRKSFIRNKKLIENTDSKLNSSQIDTLALAMTKREVRDGVQTIQYQINTLMTTNGQAPFVTLFMYFDPNYEYAHEAALIDEEILKQRIKGVKNEAGVYVTPTFPKLIYVLDEHNVREGSPYFYLTKLAAECTTKRMYPDYVSAKKMRETYDGNVFSPMGCRSFLSPWKDKNGNYKFDGRFNQGVVSINLPQIAIIANGNQKVFDELLEKRLRLCKEALLFRHNLLLGTVSDVSPIHWQYGAIARLKKGEKIDKFLNSTYSTLSLGYIGVYEACLLMTGESNTTKKGNKWSLNLLQTLRDHCDKWKKETGLGFALYGTPAETLCYRFAKIDKETYGEIKGVTDKEWYTNSYHVTPTEHIWWDEKFVLESAYQRISSGGCISYVEIPNMTHNVEAVLSMIQFIYGHIQYAEFNTKSDYCHKCGFDGEIKVNKDGEWECPRCHNKDRNYLTVTRRTCGYLGSNFWNKGKTEEISQRVEHI